MMIPLAAGRADPDAILWRPTAERAATARLTDYRRWLAYRRGLRFDGYDDLWEWSVTETGPFWRSVVDYFQVNLHGHSADAPALGVAEMPGARWFPHALVSYAEHALRHTADEDAAIVAIDETGATTTMSWRDLRRQVASVAESLRRWDIRPGDRVAGYVPNAIEAVVAFLATASIGAVWSACSPELGASTVAARFGQIRPRVLFAADGYFFGGHRHDRRAEGMEVLRALPTVEHHVHIPHLGTSAPAGSTEWSELVAHPAVPSFEHVGFDHPLWILYSSGTTGTPKAIVHSHGGILLEHSKFHGLHLDLSPGDRFLWHTTTSWMMWNVLVSGLLTGATIVLYDGSPTHPGPDRLWQIADRVGATFAGAGAAYHSACERAGLRVGDRFALERLRSVGSTGSPLPAAAARWI
ncbi:AMP-binding protein [Nocardia rhamnosiphila]|uniref:AMP-binding protein n=1 Tax=Nocardia rhamnosiphila TaxID=426716 RepID=UPI0033C16C89